MSLNDPTVHVVDNNRLKYQFYKAVRGIRGLRQSDQDNLIQWIQDLKQDENGYDKHDLIHYIPYQDLSDDQAPNIKSTMPIVTTVNRKKPSEVKRYKPFVLVHQSKCMREDVVKYGGTIVSMDSTHSTTKYGFKVFAISH